MRYFHLKKNPLHRPTVNVEKLWSLLSDNARKSAEAKKGTGKAPVLDVTKAGFFKVLGKGRVPDVPLIVKARFFSKEVRHVHRAPCVALLMHSMPCCARRLRPRSRPRVVLACCPHKREAVQINGGWLQRSWFGGTGMHAEQSRAVGATWWRRSATVVEHGNTRSCQHRPCARRQRHQPSAATARGLPSHTTKQRSLAHIRLSEVM